MTQNYNRHRDHKNRGKIELQSFKESELFYFPTIAYDLRGEKQIVGARSSLKRKNEPDIYVVVQIYPWFKFYFLLF